MLKIILSLSVLLSLLLIGCTSTKKDIPKYLIGQFQDDYNIAYKLTQNEFTLQPKTRFHIIEWNTGEQYFIAKNDSLNAYDENLYSRIDWMKFDNMEPFIWGFCLSAYNAPSADSAKTIQIADRSNPKTGCNGYPFSRMKPINHE